MILLALLLVPLILMMRRRLVVSAPVRLRAPLIRTRSVRLRRRGSAAGQVAPSASLVVPDRLVRVRTLLPILFPLQVGRAEESLHAVPTFVRPKQLALPHTGSCAQHITLVLSPGIRIMPMAAHFFSSGPPAQQLLLDYRALADRLTSRCSRKILKLFRSERERGEEEEEKILISFPHHSKILKNSLMRSSWARSCGVGVEELSTESLTG